MLSEVMRLLSRLLVYGLIVYAAAAILYPDMGFAGSEVVGLPFGLTPYEILAIPIFVLVAWTAIVSPPTERLFANRLALWTLLVYVIAQLAVVAPLALFVHDVAPRVVLEALLPRLSLLLIPFLYWYGLRALSQRRLQDAIGVAGAIVGAYAVFTFVASGPQFLLEGGDLRLRQLWGGATLLLGWVFLSRLLLYRQSLRNWMFVAFTAAGIVLTNHRSAYVALAFALLLHFALQPMSRRRWHIVVAALAITVVVIFLAGGALREQFDRSLNTVVDTNSPNASLRLERWRVGYSYFRQHPFGDNVFNGQVFLLDEYGLTSAAHNFVVEMLDYEGLQGAVFYAFFLGQIAVIGWRNRLRDPVSGFMLTYLVFYLVFSGLNANFYLSHTIFLFALPIASILSRNRTLDRLRPAAASKRGTPSTTAL